MSPSWFSRDRKAWGKALVNVKTSADALVSDKEQWAFSVQGDETDVYSCTKLELEAQVDALRGAENAVARASLRKQKWRLERTGSAGEVFQHSMTAFSRFLDNFSGIVEIAKAADQQYGGLAYGTLSLLLAVIVHKSQREEALDASFEELGLALPRMRTLQSLRDCESLADQEVFDRLEALILRDFTLVVRFAREATEYYDSKLRRLKDTVRSNEAKDRTMAEIRKVSSEIRNESDLLMLTRITALTADVKQLKLITESTRSQVADSRNSDNVNHLAKLRGILDVKVLSQHTRLEPYKDLLGSRLFSDLFIRAKHSHPEPVSLDLLRAEVEFDRWWCSPKSCLLVAGGRNCIEDYHCGSLNWLSYAAIVAVEELRQQNKHVAFFLARPVEYRKTCSWQEVMASLLYQIANMHDDLLRGSVDQLKETVESPAWKTEDADEFMDVMQPLLLDILASFPPDEELTIIIDRLDQCAWRVDDDGEAFQEMRRAIEGLLRITAKAPCRVKVLLIVDWAYSRQMTKIRFTKRDSQALILKSEWDQAVREGRLED